MKFDEFGRRMQDFGQPEEESVIRGLVTRVVGNDITVLKIEMAKTLMKMRYLKE